MKLSCTKDNLSQALALTSGVTGKNINLPILSNVMFVVDDQKVELAATNLELGIKVSVRAKIEESGSFTVPARTLADYVALLPNDKIDLWVEGNELIVRSGKSSTKIKGASAEDFPIIPHIEGGSGFTMQAEDLRQGLQQVLPAVAKNDIRPELSGVLCGFNTGGTPGLTLAATDSYRLAEKKAPLTQGADEMRIILPGRTAQEINHMLGGLEGGDGEKNVRIIVGENQIMITYGNAQIISRLVEGQYPDYTQIIPQNFQTTAVVDTAQMIKEMKASGLFTTSGVNAVTVAVEPANGSIKISSTSTQTGEYVSELPADISGSENNILLNNRYVLDGLNNIATSTTELKVINSDSACVLTPSGDKSYLYIVMPIRQ